ncbi:hypothetical protein ACIPJK_23860 [Streptomyces roseus]|uniref:phage tail protein n=1 Tax=Streptomyces roseus TaxID=66430 RepID=UPI0038178554
MAMTIGELVAVIRADESDLVQGLTRAQLRTEGFALDAGGRLRDLGGRFVTASAVMNRALASTTNAVEDVAQETTDTTAVVEVETRTMAARFRALARAADTMSDSLGARLGRAVNNLRNLHVDTDRLGSMAGRIGGIAAGFAKVGAAVGGALPPVAGLATMVAQIAPAAAVAATGLVAMQLATQAFKLGMKGVSDATSAAMDPSDPEAYAEALKKLSPAARAFVGEIRALQPELKALQQGVQERLFEGLDSTLKELGKSTLPSLKDGLNEAATSLNFMAKGVGEAAIQLGKDGTLDSALYGANEGLSNLVGIPGQLVTGLVQIAAAAGPAFGRLTAAAGGAASSLSEKLTKAFEDGRLDAAIEQAIGILKQLGGVVENVSSIVGSLFGAAQASGAGFADTLVVITGSLAEAFQSPAVQSGLKAIYSTMAELARTVGPLLVSALGAIAPVFTALGPPVQRLIAALGSALGPVIAALGPVLAAAADAVGGLVDAVSPLLPVIGSLIAQLLPALTPLLNLVAVTFKLLAPLVAQVAASLAGALAPILAALLPVIEPIVGALMTLVQAVLPILTASTAALSPVLAQVAQTFATLLVALAPVISQLILLAADVLVQLTPLLIITANLVGKLAAMFAGELSRVISGVVVPALTALTALLRGDFSAAWAAAKAMVAGVVAAMVRLLVDLPGKAGAALAGLAGVLWGKIVEAGNQMISGARDRIGVLIGHIRSVRDMARDALGSLGSVLWSAGASLIGGLIDGVKSKISSLKSTLGGITSSLPDWKGPAPVDAKILTPAGRSVIEGFQRGISQATPGLRSQLGGLTGSLPGMALAGAGAYGASAGQSRTIIEFRGPEAMKAFIRQIVQVDGRGSVVTAFE